MIVIKGRPITKKNSSRIIINQRTHKPMVIPSEKFKEYEQAALWQLKTNQHKYAGEVEVCCHYYMPDKRSWPDLIGLLQATSDILEVAGIIENDRLIRCYDGSRIMGVDKDNPRVEITIKEVV